MYTDPLWQAFMLQFNLDAPDINDDTRNNPAGARVPAGRTQYSKGTFACKILPTFRVLKHADVGM